MVVYRDEGRRVDTAAELRRLSARTSPLTRLIEIGELEAAVADAVCPYRDLTDPRLDRLRAATVAAARAWLRAGDQHTASAALSALDPSMLPSPIVLRVSEVYAYYALYPQTYAAAALVFFDTERPPGVCVIGIRSIGASLSAVVTAALARIVEVEARHLQLWRHVYRRPPGRPRQTRRSRLTVAAGARQRSARRDH